MTAATPRRIVSLLPSATEIICALGLRNQLVGRSHECDYPSGLDDLPVCTRANIDADAASADIDRQVKSHLADAASIYDIVDDALRAVRPDVIVTQDQCDVCAVALADVENAVSTRLDTDIDIISLAPQTLADALNTIVTCGNALGRADGAVALHRGLMARLDTLGAKVADLQRPRVACIEWTAPLMAAGNWVPEMVEIAGGTDVLGTPGAHSPWVTFDVLAALDPDVIVFMPCGFGLERSAAEANVCLAEPEWQQLSAVRHGRVFAVDGNSYFNRPGPRLVESTEILAEIFHLDSMPPKYRDMGWRPLIGHG